MKSTVGRADLLLLLSRAADPEAVAAQIGYDVEKSPKHLPLPPDSEAELLDIPWLDQPAPQIEPTPFWVPRHLTFLPLEDTGQQIPPRRMQVTWRDKPVTSPPILTQINTAKTAETILRILRAPDETRRLDVPKIVGKIARAEPVRRPPRLERLRPVRSIALVFDTSVHLRPFLDDAMAIARHLLQAEPAVEVLPFRYWGLRNAFYNYDDRPPRPFPPEEIAQQGDVVALSDLGIDDYGRISDRWAQLGHAVRAAGRRALAQQPIPRPLSDSAFQLWRTLGAIDPPVSGATDHVETLLTLASIAVRIEPRLLRALRVNGLPEAGYETEFHAWRHPALASIAPDAATMQPDEAKNRRAAFAALPPSQQHAAVETLRSYRGQLCDEIWFEEVLRLPPTAQDALSDRRDLQDARDYMAALRHRIQHPGAAPVSDGHHGWLARVGDRASQAEIARELEFGKAIWEVKHHDPNFAPGGDLHRYRTQNQLGLAGVRQQGDHLIIAPLAETGSHAGLWGTLASANGIFELAVLAEAEPPFHPPLTVFRDRLSDGSHGPEMVSIPTGSFMMGSPEDEEDRYPDEGLQHRVQIAHPFALSKYPVTFAEYDAFCSATGHEKPEDQGWGRGRRPVINVSWRDARAYCNWLSRETDEVYRLPSEAEWEYVCRSGTKTRYWWGDAWDKARANGALESRKTSEVDRYPANPWGLHDMHGNVGEWCEDLWQADYLRPRTQAAFLSYYGETSRVVRGGSWIGIARFCRAAFRRRYAPDDRYDSLGFRPARVQAPGVQASDPGNAERSGLRAGTAGVAEPPVERREGSPRPWRGEPTDFAPLRLRVTPGAAALAPLAALPPASFVIRTDCAELVVERVTRNTLGYWARAMGRDRFGLWAEFALDDLRQRLRYCPPGRFLMGSPDDEPGRYDREGPQRQITFAQGFWLFDTPVTQALYQAVMGENPSRFVSPTRPVEQVDWTQAQGFIGALNDRMPGLALRLPSEAEWEYACRAGTSAATYAGPMQILGKNNAPVLDNIAWYGGNSGTAFELENGEDSSGWPEKQFEHERAGTMPVMRKCANSWGFYDMLGNVWEWCADAWSDTHKGAAPDGSPRPVSQQAGLISQVVRGGSWFLDAKDCRAAYRFRRASADRDSRLGFRPARGQAPVETRFGDDEQPIDVPAGFVVLTDDDGSILTDDDGAVLIERE